MQPPPQQAAGAAAGDGGAVEGFLETLLAAHHEVMDALPFNTTAVVEAWQGPGVFDGVGAFIDAVDWSEPFFVYLLTFHIVVIGGIVVFAWGSTNRTALSMVLLLVLVLAASTLNDLGSQWHAELFSDARVNYFDGNGLFVGAVYVAPLLLVAFMLQLKMFWALFVMMVKIKRASLRNGAGAGAGGQKQVDAKQAKKKSA